MKIIKIIRGSIKINPNAGRTEIHEPAGREVSFRLDGASTLPELVEGQDYFKTEWGTNFISGVLIKPEKYNVLNAIPDITITVRQDWRTFRLMTPEPKYHYKYEDAIVKCLNCCNNSFLSEIIEDKIVGEDHEFPVQVCRSCGATDSFEPYEYEKIDNVNQKPE